MARWLAYRFAPPTKHLPVPQCRAGAFHRAIASGDGTRKFDGSVRLEQLSRASDTRGWTVFHLCCLSGGIEPSAHAHSGRSLSTRSVRCVSYCIIRLLWTFCLVSYVLNPCHGGLYQHRIVSKNHIYSPPASERGADTSQARPRPTPLKGRLIRGTEFRGCVQDIQSGKGGEVRKGMFTADVNPEYGEQ